jgi:preprotein translocase subunit SecF
VNDTIVVFDRIREDIRKDQKSDFKTLCNRAMNECLSRTVITSLTTFFAVLSLFMFGDGSIFDFALTMLIGVVAGTFSSIFIATPVMVWFYKGRRPQFSSETSVSQG